MDRPLRLIPTNQTPAAELARTVEALLVVASQPLDAEEIAGACDVEVDELDGHSRSSASATPRAASGIVLEQVAGGYAFRAAREAAEACARLFDRPADKGLSQAALETLAIVAYLGPVSRPEIAQIRGVNVDGVVSGLVERGLISEGGRDNEFGAIRYRTTPLFERVFGLESLAALPRLDDLGADVDEIRGRLEAVAEKRPRLERGKRGRARARWSAVRWTSRGDLRRGRDRGLGRAAGDRRLLGRVVRAVQGADAGARGRDLGARRPVREGRRRREPEARRGVRHPRASRR